MTKENKYNIAYSYYGQEYKYSNEWGTYKQRIGDFHTSTHIEYITFSLLLNPLSRITDKHIIELGIILGWKVRDTCPLFVLTYSRP